MHCQARWSGHRGAWDVPTYSCEHQAPSPHLLLCLVWVQEQQPLLAQRACHGGCMGEHASSMR